MSDELAAEFNRRIGQVPEYQEAYELVRKNSQGRVWLIGGFVFRMLAHQLYGAGLPSADLDFIVEAPIYPLQLPQGWEERSNSFGNPKLVGPTFSIDFIPLDAIHALQSLGLSPTIENFLAHTPLTIQSIAYDIEKRQLLGEAGLRALKERSVGVHNMVAAEEWSARYGISIEYYVREKASGLGFKSLV